MARVGRAAALVAAWLVGLAGARADEATWRHGIIQPKADAGFAMMPAEARFAGPQGIKIEIVPVQSDQVGLKAMLAGELDSYEGAPNSALVAASRGADVKIIGCGWPQLVHGIFVRSGIGGLADLKGKNIGISAPGSMPDFLIRAALAKVGLTARDVRIASLGGDTDRFKALSAGVVDGAVISTEYLPIASGDIKLLVSGRELMPQFLRGCVMTTGATLGRRREDAVRFMAAEIAGWRHAVADKADEVALTMKTTHDKADDPRPGFLFDEATKHGDVDPEMNVPLGKLAWMQDLLAGTGFIRDKADITKVADGSVRADALKRLGN